MLHSVTEGSRISTTQMRRFRHLSGGRHANAAHLPAEKQIL